jgi:RNA polymerase sigma-70 factor (ECF subfamily)
MTVQADDITELLLRWRDGDRGALDMLISRIHTELERLARQHLARERKDHPMQPSSLIQEAFLRLLRAPDIDWQNRGHFFAVASQVMRRVLVDHARARRREKRGGWAVPIAINPNAILSPGQVEHIVAIDLALSRLAEIDERKSRVFEMRFFGGLEVEETAKALNISSITVIRDWNFARAWLRRELSSGGSPCGPLETT